MKSKTEQERSEELYPLDTKEVIRKAQDGNTDAKILLGIRFLNGEDIPLPHVDVVRHVEQASRDLRTDSLARLVSATRAATGMADLKLLREIADHCSAEEKAMVGLQYFLESRLRRAVRETKTLRNALQGSQCTARNRAAQVKEVSAALGESADRVRGLEHLKDDLEKRLSEVSTETLQTKVDHLTQMTAQAESRATVAEQAAAEIRRTLADLHAQLSDLERHNAYLQKLLRKNGIIFNPVWGHGEGHRKAA